MTIPQVAEVMAVGWFVIELSRRIIILAYQTWREGKEFRTVRQYQAYKEDLRGRIKHL